MVGLAPEEGTVDKNIEGHRWTSSIEPNSTATSMADLDGCWGRLATLELLNYHIPNTMARMLKRWESPRKEGRNDKGKGGSARRRQLKKQMQMLRKQLKSKGSIDQQQDRQKSDKGSGPGRELSGSLFFGDFSRLARLA
jgi:hypothetical protein